MLISQQLKLQGQWLFKRRGYLPIFLLVAGMITLYFSIDPINYDWQNMHLYLLIVAILLSVFGMGIRIYTVGFTPDFTSGRNTASQVADKLNTEGAYSIVRHPLYLGNFFIYLGIAVLTINIVFILIFVLIFFFYYERIIYAEECFLKDKFDEKYSVWSTQTPTIIPAFSKYQKSIDPFNWWKAFEREKSGILSYFIVLFIFQVVRCFRIEGNYFLECGWSFGIGILATAYYFTMKILSRRRLLVPT